MSTPIKLLGESISTYPQFRLNRFQVEEMQQYCVKKLEVKDLGQLRDKYEGQAFLENIIRRVGAYIVALDFFNLPKPRLDYDFIDQFKPVIKIDDDKCVVVVFDSNSFPYFSTHELKKPRIFVYDLGELKFGVCGVADVNVLNDNLNFRPIGERTREFIGFDKLKI